MRVNVKKRGANMELNTGVEWIKPQHLMTRAEMWIT